MKNRHIDYTMHRIIIALSVLLLSSFAMGSQTVRSLTGKDVEFVTGVNFNKGARYGEAEAEFGSIPFDNPDNI